MGHDLRCRSDASFTAETLAPAGSKSWVQCTILSEHGFSIEGTLERLMPMPHMHPHRFGSMCPLGLHWISISSMLIEAD